MIAEVTVVPLQKGINHIGGWMGDMKDNFQTLKEVRAENKKLQEQVDSLVIENNNLQQERYELERLQELYQLDQSYSDYKRQQHMSLEMIQATGSVHLPLIREAMTESQKI